MNDTEQRLLSHRFTADDPLRMRTITLSDRAASGEYEDKSGPKIHKQLEILFHDREIEWSVESAVLADDAEALEKEVTAARDGGTQVVITTGGTGLGPRDITPDVVLRLADKTIPGVMEAIRLKHGEDDPRKLLSRTVAAVIGTTLVYVLPGSPKAIDEYMPELLKTLPHLLCVVHDLRVH